MQTQIFKNFLTYSIGAIILRCITAIISFISITFLSVEEYGILSLINTFIWIAPILLSLGLRQAYALDFFHNNFQKRKSTLNEIISIYLLISLPILILILLNLNLINKYLFLNQLDLKVLVIILAICFFSFFTELLFLILRYQNKSLQFTISQIAMGTITLISTIIFCYLLKLKIFGYVLANFCGIFAIALCGAYLYFKKVKSFRFNYMNIKYFLKQGFPFIPNLIFFWFLSFADRWLLSKYVTLHEVGIFSFADSFAQLFQIVVSYPLSNTYVPYLLKTFSENKENIVQITIILKTCSKQCHQCFFCAQFHLLFFKKSFF